MDFRSLKATAGRPVAAEPGTQRGSDGGKDRQSSSPSCILSLRSRYALALSPQSLRRLETLLAFFLSQRHLDGGRHLFVGRRHPRSPFGDHLAATIDEVLLEVPGDRAGYVPVGVGRKEFVERTLILTLYRDLGEQVERDALFGAELLDFLVGPRLLLVEVVGRKGENVETLVLVLLECRLQTGVL